MNVSRHRLNVEVSVSVVMDVFLKCRYGRGRICAGVSVVLWLGVRA